MDGRVKPLSSERRLIYFLVPFLIAFQIGAFALMWFANRRIATDKLEDELESSSQVFKYAIAQRSEYLKQATDLVAKDYGFREAVSSNSRPTIESALKNQNVRMGSSLTVLSTLDDAVSGKSMSQTTGFLADYPGLSDASLAAQVQAVQPGQSALRALRLDTDVNVLYQWVKTVVRTPAPSAHLSFAFKIDDQIAAQFRQITNSDFVFLSREGDGPWTIQASSYDPETQGAMVSKFTNLQEGFWSMRAGANSYRMLTVELGRSGNSRVVAVVGQSLEEAMATFVKLERIFTVLIVFNVLLSVIAVYRVTNKIVAPLDKVAYQDSLTRLANRRLFELNLQLASENLKALGRGYSLMVMDLNKFKAINDTLGHAAGDQVLQEAARRIQGILRSSDTVARLGGDEFAVLLITNDRHKASEIAAMIVDRVRQPMTLADGKVVDVGVSIGVARAPENGTATEELLHLADEAMYAAKVRACGFTFA
ncbi:diguanylate cyclase domain-containing protein [Xylophilus sp. GOD-11R]|uniref:diguanylate cyclase domain-containing protein n=1 Tax=Xylophilus sp. GOD-11R TaxID=3089814 RepID=UPI00298D4084|nr:diguanylate cyclase [Xylophilus sp. GOD-11R]WPB55635.1 diguanylate cyclase [Xylophilus sp. GOD-11R]